MALTRQMEPSQLITMPTSTEALTRAEGVLERAKVNEEARTIELSFSSEMPYGRWFGSEILSHDPNAIDLTRLNETGVVLFAHGRDVVYGKMPIGSIERAWIDVEARKARAIIKFDTDAESDKVFQKVKNGVIKGVSVGYNVTSWEEVLANRVSSNGRFMGPASVAVKWEPYEISIEPIPADPSVGVGRSKINEGENQTMPSEANQIEGQRTQEPAPVAQPPQNAATMQRAVEEERNRVTEIATLCRAFNVDDAEYIRTGTSVQAVKDAILKQQMQARGPQTQQVQVRAEEVDKFRAAASDALLIRAGRTIAKPADGATELRGMSLRDLAIDCLHRAGESGAHRLSSEELLKRALSPDNTFQSIISNAVNKTLGMSYRETPTTFQEWTGKGSNSDFKAAEHYRISEAGNLERLPQNGIIQYDQPMTDEKVTKSVLTYAKSWGFTREAFINDDLSVLNRIPAAYVMSAKRGINSLVYRMLAQNPVIYNGRSLFHDDHNNIGTASAINTASLSEARKKMRTQKDLRGIATLNIAPKYLIVPAELETLANQYMRSESELTSNNSGVVNVFRNSYKTIIDAELDQYSTSAWYLAADQSIADTIEVTYLRGQEEPTLETDVPFDRLGINFRIYFDYGVTVTDHKGLFMNAGVGQ